MDKEEAELIIKEQDKNTKEILKVIEKEKCELLGIIQGKDKAIKDLKAQIEKMKCDVLSLIKDGMNDDIDQNIIERLAEKWEIKENG